MAVMQPLRTWLGGYRARHAALSLRQQLVFRFIAVFALVTVCGSLAALMSYQSLTEQARHQRSDQSARHLARSFEVLHENWAQNAHEIRIQIDTMGLFAQGFSARDGERLRNYFGRQEGELHRFPSGVLLDQAGTPVFHFGPDGSELRRRLLAQRERPSWMRVNKQYLVLAVLDVPIMLGSRGEGTLVLLQPMDAYAMRLLAPYDSRVLLVHENQVVASSESDLDLGRAIDTHYNGMTKDDVGAVEQRTLSIFPDDASAPKLVMWRRLQPAVSPKLVLAGSFILMSLLAMMLWLVQGRWTDRIARRIVRLSEATHEFSRAHTLTPQVEQALEAANAAPDEVGEVALASRELMQSVIRHNQEHFAYLQTLDILEEGVVELGPQGQYRRSSPGWSRLAGPMGKTIQDSLHADDRGDFTLQLDQLFSGAKASVSGRARVNRSERELWVEYRFIAGEIRDGQVQDVRGVLRDITQSYQLEKHVTHMALHDALTGLPNRVLLEDRCKMALRGAERNGSKVALGFLDLDHFKHINDQFGHKTGDELLMALATTLRQCLRAGDTLARWGGDEFVVLLPDLSCQADAEEVISKLIAVSQHPVLIGDTEFNATFSMGAAMSPDDAASVETLLSQADRAMFAAKQQGRNTVCFYSEMAQKEDERKAIYIQNRLATAIREGRVQVWYQPIVDARTRRIVSCEALARWHDELHGWVSPATFVPMAENLGLIREMGQQIWKQAITQLHHWRECGADVRLSVNVSRRQLFSQTFTADLQADLDRLAIPVGAVDLEITESVAMEDAEHTERRLAELTQAGFGIAIDDFGTGYSSLSQLHNMPATKIKIDISFVRRAHTTQGAQLIQAVVKIASAFGLQTVAEGVESEEVALALTQQGVDLLQGYHFGAPMSAEDFEACLGVKSEGEPSTS